MAEPLELSIDTASSMASISLTREGRLVAELTWDCGRDHSRHLLPAIDLMLKRQAAGKTHLRAIFVDIGPGAYGGLRAGVSLAKGLAHGLEISIVGVGRLEADAYPFAATGATIAALHRAGRRQLAWAAYSAAAGWHEVVAPRLNHADEIATALPEGALVTGEVDDELAAALTARGHATVRGAAALRRAASLAELAWQRFLRDDTDDAKTLVPLYLREPAIGPQS